MLACRVPVVMWVLPLQRLFTRDTRLIHYLYAYLTLNTQPQRLWHFADKSLKKLSLKTYAVHFFSIAILVSLAIVVLSK